MTLFHSDHATFDRRMGRAFATFLFVTGATLVYAIMTGDWAVATRLFLVALVALLTTFGIVATLYDRGSRDG